MGKEVVRELQENRTAEAPRENSRENGPDVVPAERPHPPTPSTRETRGQTTEDTVPVRMNSEPVQAVLEMGFSEDLVKQTVEKCLLERPGNFPPAEQLASMVMELEELEAEPATAAPPLTPLQRMMAANGSANGSDVRSGIHDSHSGASKALSQKKMVNGFGAVNSNGVHNVTTQGLKGGAGVDFNTDKLRTENSKMKDQLLCKICLENLVRVTFMPCGHLVCCGPCSMTMSECPICRTSITGCVRTYF